MVILARFMISTKTRSQKRRQELGIKMTKHFTHMMVKPRQTTLVLLMARALTARAS